MKPKFFSNQNNWRAWLLENHLRETEILVGFYKTSSGEASMSWSESVDQALCFGWIDGVRKSIDAKSYTIRFTPRKPNSIWSAVNIAKIEQLHAKNLILPAGHAAFEKRKEHRSKIYAYENETGEFSTEFETLFQSNTKAWDFFKTQAPSYRKASIHWVMTAKQESTRKTRLEKLISASEKETRR